MRAGGTPGGPEGRARKGRYENAHSRPFGDLIYPVEQNGGHFPPLGSGGIQNRRGQATSSRAIQRSRAGHIREHWVGSRFDRLGSVVSWRKIKLSERREESCGQKGGGRGGHDAGKNPGITGRASKRLARSTIWLRNKILGNGFLSGHGRRRPGAGLGGNRGTIAKWMGPVIVGEQTAHGKIIVLIGVVQKRYGKGGLKGSRKAKCRNTTRELVNDANIGNRGRRGRGGRKNHPR